MATVKMAFSVEKEVLEEIGKLARQRKVPRNQLITEALEQYLERLETKALVESCNEAYADGLDEDDKKFLDAALRRMGQRAKEEGW
jgi:metal-responsive CopG/Arc/MetJ family transcriptional regulator